MRLTSNISLLKSPTIKPPTLLAAILLLVLLNCNESNKDKTTSTILNDLQTSLTTTCQTSQTNECNVAQTIINGVEFRVTLEDQIEYLNSYRPDLRFVLIYDLSGEVYERKTFIVLASPKPKKPNNQPSNTHTIIIDDATENVIQELLYSKEDSICDDYIFLVKFDNGEYSNSEVILCPSNNIYRFINID
ncbi:hypothetical protein A3850_003400 [Lewinella sp. 4G2]|nr:hypothetical protein A3850_003400 [Lewinella sp. 4G2]